ncbi:uncharacterized protein PRCAT00001069001 [Priceomyces carsonii]|uniref:uncharacterized protein n=1 Tax=Priceomyces carsonii TaxID=28549 RepID=UPI002EDB3F57|nr:unnamed protein product [Priceomyces carsonii]
MDRYCYTSPSRVQTLLVPINGCLANDFLRYISLIRSSVEEVRLLDIPPSSSLHLFNPQSFPNGRVMFNFTTSSPEDESIFLHDLEPFRKTFIITGIGKYNDAINNKVGLEAVKALKETNPSSIVHNVIYFDTPKEKIEEYNPPSDHSYQAVFYHNGSMKYNITSLETIFCDISRDFLAKLDIYASSYQNITLRSPVSISNTNVLTKTINQAQKRLSSGSTSFKMTLNNGNGQVSSATDVKKKTQQSHKGRQLKLMGSLFLLAGNYQEAIQQFGDAIANLKSCEDYLWLASALEGLGVALTLSHYSGNSFQNLNPAISSVLQISRNRIPSFPLSTSGERLTIKRSSNDSFTANHSSPNFSKPSTSDIINHTQSPRNSMTSFSGVGTSSLATISELSSLPLPTLIQMISSKVSSFYQLSTNNHESMVPDIVYVECILRHIKFMLGVFVGGNSMSSEVLDNVVKGTVLIPKKSSDGAAFFLKHDILREIDKLFSLQLVELSIIDQCRIYSTLATVYSDLGLLRKKAFMLRILLVGILPHLNSLHEHSHEKNISKSFHASSIRDLFNFLFVVYGIGEESESDISEAIHHAQGVWTSLRILLLRLCMNFAEAMEDHIFLLEICSLLLTRYCNSLTIDDQLKLKAKIDYTLTSSARSSLDLNFVYWDPYLVRRAKLINDKSKDDLVPFTEYEKNSNNVGQIVGATLSLSREKLNSQILPRGPIIFNPYEKTKSESINRDKLLLKDEVYRLKITLQNPFAFEIEIMDISIVADSDDDIKTLGNQIKPLATIGGHAIQMQNRPNGLMKLRKTFVSDKQMKSSTSIGTENQTNAFLSSTSDLIVPSRSMQLFSVAFLPLKVGELNIKGFKVTLFNCKPQFFQIVEKELTYDLSKVKYLGLGKLDFRDKYVLKKAQDNLEFNDITSRVLTKVLSLTVIPLQPTLTLNEILIANRWIMLLEGETYKFSISLSNSSDQDINYLSFSFWDSTLEPINRKLTSSGHVLLASEIYELEWLLMNQKTFKILNKAILSRDYKVIKPQDELKIDYEITGKKGMKLLKIILEYANKNVDDLSKTFVKFMHIPLNVSVVPLLDVVNCDLIHLIASSIKELMSNLSDLSAKNFKTVLAYINLKSSHEPQESKYCLLVVDLRNSWNESVIARLNLNFAPDEDFRIEEAIRPGKTARFLLPLRRVSTNEIDLSRSIPSLRKKQYIKNFHISEEEEETMRSHFWLRNHILEHLEGTWETMHDSMYKRKGSIHLRSFYLTNRMAQAMVYPQVEIFNTILNDADDAIAKHEGCHFILESDEFYTWRTTISNHTKYPISGILRQIPYPVASPLNSSVQSIKYQLSLDRRILIHGVLQSNIERVILPGDSVNFDLTFLVLEKGEYEWGSVLDVLTPSRSQICSRDPIFIHT